MDSGYRIKMPTEKRAPVMKHTQKFHLHPALWAIKPPIIGPMVPCESDAQDIT